MNRIATTVAVALAAFFLSSCASGKVRSERAAVKRPVKTDQISEKRSSYRVRGTEEKGTLSPVRHRQLKSRVASWSWPVHDVHITSRFGTRGGDHHDGIDLRAPTGTPVLAAAPGKVIYSGQKIRGYGKMVVLKHDAKLSTIYAHNSKLYVKRGDQVRRGQRIALSGSTGRSTGPHVHFEIREGVTAINPSSLLPSPSVVREANRRIAQRTGRPASTKRTGGESVRTSQAKAEKSSGRRPSKRYEQYSNEKKRVARETRKTSQSSPVRAPAKKSVAVKKSAAPAARRTSVAARLATDDDGFDPKKRLDLVR